MIDSTRLQPELPELTVVIAHPDDEIIFFFNAIRSLAPRKLHLVCAVSRFDRDETVRNREIERSARHLGATLSRLGLHDEISRENPDHAELVAALLALRKAPGVPVLTHGPMGEYGHIVHVAVFRAACSAFGADTWALSGPLDPHQIFQPVDGGTAAQRALFLDLYPSQGKCALWICGEESFTRVASDPFAPIFLPDPGPRASHGLRAELLAQLARSYLGPSRDQPLVARRIGEAWDAAQMHARLKQRYEEWQALLMTDSADPPADP